MKKAVFKPSWIARLLRCSVREIIVHIDEVKIVTRHETLLVDIDGLSSLGGYERRFFFNVFTIAGHSFWGFNDAEIVELLTEVKRSWYQHKLPAIKAFESTLRNRISSEFIRDSGVPAIIQSAKDMRVSYQRSPPAKLLSNEEQYYFDYIDQIVETPESFFDKARSDFIELELEEYQDFFDTVESQKLAERQRLACVTDNDNNLVLAGAGTGKTSTMVGKAGYLVQSGRAKPEEILMLAYGGEAANELQGRINDKLKNSSIRAATFHALGRAIIAKVEGRKPGLSKLAEDGVLCKKFVDTCLDELLQDEEYEAKAIRYFDRYLFPDKNPFDFESEGDYLDYLESNEIRSLKGDEVKSYGELLIANFFFLNGIDYEYERQYEIPTYTESFQQYLPDFYLPEYGIYLEYYGIDEDGNTAPYIDAQKYNESIEWKRNLHQENNTTCLEAFHYQKVNGDLLETLATSLQEKGVCIEPLPRESILETLREKGSIRVLASLLKELLSSVKSRCRTIEEAISIAERASNAPQSLAALELLIPILNRYESELRASGQIDFDDMIQRAVGYVLDGRFRPKWKYILVDEFQDIAASRANLILALRDATPNCALFCVGDDWQSIYRFSGSDLNYTTQFRKIFGPYSVTSLNITYRFNNSICDIASKFVTQNKVQVKKDLETHVLVAEPAISVLRREGSYDWNHVREALDRIAARVKGSASVYIICRYKYIFTSDNAKTEIRGICKDYPNLDIQTESMHGSKGKQADFVIVIGLEKGKYGFPCEKETHPLLEAYLPTLEPYPYAEERRLFYVAMTRAKTRVYLLADMTRSSVFMTQLLKEGEYELCLDEFDTPLEQLEYQALSCPACKTGNLTIRMNSDTGVKFAGCSHYKRCKHTEPCCPQCFNLMKRDGRCRVCVACDWKVAVCKVCPGEMRQRPGGYWGCSNYRGKDTTPSCRHMENEIEF